LLHTSISVYACVVDEGSFMKVSILGLGIIGSIWADNYARDGVLAASWNRTAKPAAPRSAASALAAAEAGDLIQIVVADPLAVNSVLDSIAPALGPNKLVVQSSTIDPESSARFEAFTTERGALYVEAPFTGSKPAAEARQTVFYLGGASESVARAEPLLARISSVRLLVGSGAQAATLKLAMNMQIACAMQALSEALHLSRSAGVADDVFFKVLERNAAHSGVVKLKEDKLRRADFTPQFSVKHMHKDIRLALAAVGEGKAPATEAARGQLSLAEERGFADEDFSALLKLL
jgi:glyoxylate/succinic semialdehyde reductase